MPARSWELERELALLSRLPRARDDDAADDDADDDAAVAAAVAARSSDDDRAARVDEIVALRAIFGEDGDLLGPAADAAARDALEDVVGLFRFDLRVRPELGEGENDADARARLVVSRRDDDDDDDGGGGVEIVSLPPVTLSVILPSDYPSVSPPAFALSASWLSRAALTRAADALDDVCARNAGDVIAFELAAWLKDESAREVFCVDGRLRLRASDGWAGEADDGGGGGDGDGDDGGGGGGATASADAAGSPPPPRGIPTSRGVDDAALAIMRHDATERARRFARAVVRCDVCFDDVAGSDTARVAPGACAHFFCASCVATIARTHVVEGNIASLVCPACGASIPPHVLRRFLSDELYERYETIALERSLAAMPDASRCPRCERVVIEDGDDHCGRCLGCEYTFCGLCRESWHPGESCLTPERKLEVLRSRGGSGAMAALGEDARRKHREQLADAMALRYVEKEGQRCPNCGFGVVKSEGCNKMTCGNCETRFCYKCGDAVDGYEHFRDGGKCALFDLDAVAAWEREMNAARLNAEGRQRDAYVAGDAIAPSNCPSCRQMCYKLANNNHIRCWSCGQRYCHLCRKTVRRGAETAAHFGPGVGKCRQHSAD